MKKFITRTFIFNIIIIILSLIFHKSFTSANNNVILFIFLNGVVLIEVPLFFYFLEKSLNK